MLYRAVLLLIPFLVLAEAPKAPAAPKKVDQALRQRASEFLQDQVDGNFRKALDLVAEDTKDYYFTTAKLKLFSFKIENIEYSDKFTKAKVDSSVRKLYAGAIPIEITVTQTDTWKLVNGKWMWYYIATGSPLQDLTGQAIPKDANPAALAAAASKITAITSVDKQSLTFTRGSAGMEQVVFHNGNRGPVKLVSDIIGNPEEFMVEPPTALVAADQDFTVKITYTPVGPIIPAKVRLTVDPFRQQILIPVTFASTPPPEK